MNRLMKVFLVLVLCAGHSGAYGTVPCSDGEILYSGKCRNDCIKFIVQEASQGMDHGNALKLTPDAWHSPVYRINCTDKSRMDFSAYNILEFYFRTPSPDPGNPTLSLHTWNQRSREVEIRNYISGGIIDNTFRLVSIPLSQLVTERWDLGNVESLEWNKDSKRRIYYVDNIKLRQTEPPALITEGKWRPSQESDNVLRLTFSKRWLQETVRDRNNYSISSLTDPSYLSPVHPLNVGLHYRVETFSPSRVARNRFCVFIRLPKPLKNGSSYTLRVHGVKDEFCNLMEPTELVFAYDENAFLNTNIKINQEGYLPGGPKVGYVGGYLGDLGGGAWAVGDNGAIFFLDHKTTWRRVDPIVSATLRGVSGIREDNIYAVGDDGVILNWNGTTWGRIESPTTSNLLATHFGPTGIGWAVGDSGVILRYDKGNWTPVPTPSNKSLRGVWAGPGDTAWAVGDSGTILRWEGKQWTPENSYIQADLCAIYGDQTNQLMAVGANGTVLLRSSGKWKVFSSTPATSATLRSIITDPSGNVWIGGDDGLLWQKSGSGKSEFLAGQSGTSQSIYGITRQHARQLWAVGSHCAFLSFNSPALGWRPESVSCQENLRAVFSLPFGALRLPEPPPAVTLLDVTTGKTAITVPLKLESANWRLSGEDVYSFDFSALEKPGSYRAYVPGLGLSDIFRIDNNVLDYAAYTMAHAFYYQRCGAALTEPYADKRFVRPVCHEFEPNGRKLDAAFHESLPRTPLYSSEIPGAMMDGHGGWHDAGDYGKYVPTAAAALWYLFTAYDMDPTKFRDGTWNIPESGNGTPDILDEARWELDWIVRMQGSDGGVYHKLTSQEWFEGMPQEEKAPRYFFEKTTNDTASAAAVLACAARLWKPYDKVLSDFYLERALKAWDFLKLHSEMVPKKGFRNPPGNPTGDYQDPEDVDNRLWASGELYRTTGQPTYRTYFESWWAKNSSHPWGWNAWQHSYRCAYWAYLRSPWPDGNPGIKQEIKKGIIRKADDIVTLTYSNPYRNGAKLSVPEWIGWGCFTQSSEYSFCLLQAWSLTNAKKYLNAALLNLDTQLGANPLSLCFITGLGKRSPMDPLHQPSIHIHDGVKAPFPGLPIFGVAAHLPNNQPYYIQSQKDENSFPPAWEPNDPYPILRRYIDAHQLVPMSEFTIVDMAACAAALNLLAQGPERTR
jgi:photosystem II stability/assembly factor-like uncharacterized protein